MAIPTPLASYNLNGNSTDAISANNGTDTAITYSTGNGKIIQGAGFNGSTSMIKLPASSIRPTGNFTINAWIKTSNTGTYKAIAQTYSQLSNIVSGFRFHISNANKLELISGKNTGVTQNTDWKLITGTTTVTSGNWTMVSGVYNGSTLELFVNGVSDGSVAWTNNAVYQSDSKPSIGANNYQSTSIVDYFNGAIDIVDIFNTNLLVSDLLYLYNSGAGREYPFAGDFIPRVTIS